MRGGRPENILSFCIDATSGTIVPVDQDLNPLRDGLMYNDARADKEAERLNVAGQKTLRYLGYRFNASFSLAKILWLMENEPAVKDMAKKFDLNPTCRIVGGMTDGTAGCAASGANKIGDMNTTLGSTIVWKSITSDLVCDPTGRLYCHRHPGGGFLPGGAGNSGGEGLSTFFKVGAKDLSERLDRLAAGITPGPPTGTITYPLPSPGERFPFVDSKFEPFTTASHADQLFLYRSCLEGIACIERWGYEVGAGLGAECSGTVWTTGMGAVIDPWLQIRADFLDRPVCRVSCPESAYGAALVAAMNIWFDGSWEDTAAHLIRESFHCEPRAEYRNACHDQYLQFREVCEKRRKSS